MNYPVYRPTYSTYRINSTSGTVATPYPTITPVGAAAPRRLGGSEGGFTPSDDEDDFLDWGDGNGESGGGTIGIPQGNHTGEATPIGDACWPLLAILIVWFVFTSFYNKDGVRRTTIYRAPGQARGK